MFTGIIEAQATVEDHVLQGENLSSQFALLFLDR